MKVRFWGTRGSLASPGPYTARFGGNTSCVEVRADDGSVIVLDAGTGISRLDRELPEDMTRIDILLTHLHMDHIQGLGFFAPLRREDFDVHMWGPPSTAFDLSTHLGRYLSPPLFPIHLREFACHLTLHEIADCQFEIGPFHVSANLVCHPGPTLGYRIEADGASVAYLPDHELGFGAVAIDGDPRWISGFDLMLDVDLLIHDAQYTVSEKMRRRGWGHSTPQEAVRIATRAGASRVALFHHSPDHDDSEIDLMVDEARRAAPDGLEVFAAAEGQVIEFGRL